MALESVQGRMVDLDSHLMLLPDEMDDVLGPYADTDDGRRIRGDVRQMLEWSLDGESLASTRRRARADVWGVKGWGAHGAQVAADRVEALDHMGIDRQLVFPAFMEGPMHAHGEEGAAAESVVSRYNDYVLDWSKESNGRLEPVCILNTQERGAAVAEARRVLEGGAQAVQLPFNVPMAGMSPAAPEWDPLWAMMAEAGAAVVYHMGGPVKPAQQFINPAWLANAATLRPGVDDPSADDVHAPPFIWMTLHMAVEVELSFLVLGGVLDRHPALRVGVIELGAGWVASWCRRMDTIATEVSAYLSRQLSMKPSDYVRRQVRVTPYVFEPVATWIDESGFDEVYAFSTDYPHLEGGLTPVETFEARLARLAGPVRERFFVGNGSLILPQRATS